jgi:hypothetical protein
MNEQSTSRPSAFKNVGTTKPTHEITVKDYPISIIMQQHKSRFGKLSSFLPAKTTFFVQGSNAYLADLFIYQSLNSKKARAATAGLLKILQPE